MSRDLIQEFEDALIAHRIASRVLQGTEFPSEKAYEDYMRKHPKADPNKHEIVQDFKEPAPPKPKRPTPPPTPVKPKRPKRPWHPPKPPKLNPPEKEYQPYKPTKPYEFKPPKEYEFKPPK